MNKEQAIEMLKLMNQFLQTDPLDEEKEKRRLEELYQLNIVDTEPEREYDELTQLVSDVFHAPIAFISFLTEERQWFKSCVGTGLKEMNRDHSVCQYTIATRDILVIEDLMADDRTKDNPILLDYGLRFYAGAPIVTENGHIVGTLCIMDTHPRSLSNQEKQRLEQFANLATTFIQQRSKVFEARELQKTVTTLNYRLSMILSSIQEVVFQTDLQGHVLFVTTSWETSTGYSTAETLGKTFFEPVEIVDEVHPITYIQRVQQEHGNQTFTIHYKDKSGAPKWALCSISFKADEGTGHVCGTLTDITLKMNLEADKRHEIELAKVVQHSVLSPVINRPDIRIRGEFQPSHDLSGDLYYWDRLSDHRYGVFLMDVVGHGTSAALISMSVHSQLHGLFSQFQDPVDIMNQLNRHMHGFGKQREDEGSSYFTAMCLLIDTETKTIQYVNAGHPPALLLNQNDVVALDVGTTPIGLIEPLPIEKAVISYQQPSTIYLYTDGLLEITKLSSKKIMNWVTEHWEQANSLSHLDKGIFSLIHLPDMIPDDLCVVTVELF